MIAPRFTSTLTVALAAFSILATRSAPAQHDGRAQPDWPAVQNLIDSSCLHCHDQSTDTALDLESLNHDLTNPDTFRRWERVFDRSKSGEMPPESEDRPDPGALAKALDRLGDGLEQSSRKRQRARGRVPARRLTKSELNYTLQDLLSLQGDLTAAIPDEVESGSFDTIGTHQRVSAVHMKGYLKTANDALDRAIQLGRNPQRRWNLDFVDSPFLLAFHDKPLNLGGSVTRLTDDGVALFRDADYLLSSGVHGFTAPISGIYRITTKANAYQSNQPITIKLIRKAPSGASKVLVVKDLSPDHTETFEVSAFISRGSHFYTTFEQPPGYEPFSGISAAGGVRNYKGLGIEVRSQSVVGPVSETWPPPFIRDFFEGVDGSQDSASMKEVKTIVQRFAQRALRRPIRESELEPFLELAQPAINQGQPIANAVRVPLGSILSSPQFLIFDGPPGPLDDHSLANRLSYFLWKSMPDDELFRAAEGGNLSSPEHLSAQVDRMLSDPKSDRFVKDFVGQWLRLDKVNATSPDETLYSEYDEVLGRSIPLETERFFAELIRENLSLSNLIDSDFTFLNRRLAEHYKFPPIEGQELRRTRIPDESIRGGVLTQAAILKTTANGTTTSPVTRGNFVLTNFLGTPPSPPPPDVGSIEPDTRGKTTIREILDSHRDIESCNQCHRLIDPPGFAMECFDPIGGYRTHYRATSPPNLVAAFFGGGDTVVDGPVVDASGVTSDGESFSGMDDYKKWLLQRKDQVATNFIRQLVMYSTGGEIEFADRAVIDAIAEVTSQEDYPIRDIIHQVVQSRLFRNK